MPENLVPGNLAYFSEFFSVFVFELNVASMINRSDLKQDSPSGRGVVLPLDILRPAPANATPIGKFASVYCQMPDALGDLIRLANARERRNIQGRERILIALELLFVNAFEEIFAANFDLYPGQADAIEIRTA